MFHTGDGLLKQVNRTTEEGFKEVFATNVFGHFILVSCNYVSFYFLPSNHMICNINKNTINEDAVATFFILNCNSIILFAYSNTLKPLKWSYFLFVSCDS